MSCVITSRYHCKSSRVSDLLGLRDGSDVSSLITYCKSVSLHVQRVHLCKTCSALWMPAVPSPLRLIHWRPRAPRLWMCVMCSCDLLDIGYLLPTQTGIHADTLHVQTHNAHIQTHRCTDTNTHTHARTHIAKLRQLKKRSHEGRTVRNETAGGHGDREPSGSWASGEMPLMDWRETDQRRRFYTENSLVQSITSLNNS